MIAFIFVQGPVKVLRFGRIKRVDRLPLGIRTMLRGPGLPFRNPNESIPGYQARGWKANYR